MLPSSFNFKRRQMSLLHKEEFFLSLPNCKTQSRIFFHSLHSTATTICKSNKIFFLLSHRLLSSRATQKRRAHIHNKFTNIIFYRFIMLLKRLLNSHVFSVCISSFSVYIGSTRDYSSFTLNDRLLFFFSLHSRVPFVFIIAVYFVAGSKANFLCLTEKIFIMKF